MAIRTSLLSTRNINLDTDFSKYIETVSEPGVIEGFALANSKIGLGKARVPCERTNGETIYALVQNFNEVSISGNGYVIISIAQNIIDDGSLGSEDGTGIATVEVVSELPTKNYLELYEISELGLITDKRNMIKKVGELNTAIETLQGQIDDLDIRVEALEEAGAIDHLEEMGYVGERYAMTDKLFKQFTPKLNDSNGEANVGDVADNTEIHIQRMSSGTSSNKLKLKMKKGGSPTTNLTVEVRKGIKVDVSDTEAYWYGDEDNIIATGTLPSSSFSSDFAEVEFTLDNYFGDTEGELLDVVLYQENSGTKVVNASNYYVFACDVTQWSEAFSYVKVNGDTRARSYLMPYCVSDGFMEFMLCKVVNATKTVAYNKQVGYQERSGGSPINNTITTPYNGNFTITARYVNTNSYTNTRCSVSGGGNQLGDYDAYAEKDKTVTLTYTGSGTASIRYYNNAGSVPGATYLTLVCNNLNLYRKPDNLFKLLPRELKDVGNKIGATSFGTHIDGEFFNDLPKDVKLYSDNYSTTSSDITNFYGNIVVKIGSYKYYIPLTNRTNA